MKISYGTQITTNLNGRYVKLAHEALKESGKRIGTLIKEGKAKEAINEIIQAKIIKDTLNSNLRNSRKIIIRADKKEFISEIKTKIVWNELFS